jgi:antitoxin ParD1/3/4
MSTASLNISLPEPMRVFINEQVAKGGYSTASEYIRDLVRAEQRRASGDWLDRMLADWAESQPPRERTQADWEKLRRAAKERIDQLLIEGIESGPPRRLPENWVEEKIAKLEAQAHQQQGP